MFNVTYAVGNEIYAAKCFILGWVVWSDGYDPEPINGVDATQADYLKKMYVGSLYPDELKKAIQDRLDMLEKQKEGVLTQLTNTDKYEGVLVRTPVPFKEFDGDELSIEIDFSKPLTGMEAVMVTQEDLDRLSLPVVHSRNPELNTDFNKTKDIVVYPINPSPTLPVLKEFPMAHGRFHLVTGQVEHGNEVHQLMMRFGNVWNPVPFRKDVFFVKGKTEKDATVQMTMRVSTTSGFQVPFEIAVYTEFTFEEFKANLETGIFMDCSYHLINDKFCMGQRIIDALKVNEVW